MKNEELKLFYQQALTEAGCDEAGRGCIAGPVFAAAVILPENFSAPELNDSKKLSEKQRNRLRIEIEKYALAWHVASADEDEIFKHNILKASILAMHRAISGLSIKPGFVIVDGNRFIPIDGIAHQCIVKGDGKFLSIAAASVLCKCYRDDYMRDLHRQHPEYGWDVNKGYPTATHRKAVMQFGPTLFHRKGFRLLKDDTPELF